MNERITDLHILAATDFRGFAQLLPAVNVYGSACHNLLADATAAAQPNQVQQVLELDIFSLEPEIEPGLQLNANVRRIVVLSPLPRNF